MIISNSVIVSLFVVMGLVSSNVNLNFKTVIDEDKSINSRENTILILQSNYTCAKCLQDLMQQIDDSGILQKQSNVSLYIIDRCNNSILERRRQISDFKKLVGDFKCFNSKNVLFDIHGEEDPWPPKNLKDGLFGKFDVSITPAVIFIKNDSLKYVTSSEVVSDTAKVYECLKWYY